MMECRKLNLFLSDPKKSNLQELGVTFNDGGYTIACDGYRLGAIRTGLDSKEELKGKQKSILKMLETAIENAKTADTFRFSRDLKDAIEKKYKEIRVASETTVYKRDLILGLNYTTGEYVLFFNFERREKKETDTYQYFNYKYFSDLLEFFPRFVNLDISYRAGHKFTEIFAHLGTRYSLLLPMRVNIIK